MREVGVPLAPSSDLPDAVRVTCEVVVAPLVQHPLIMDPRAGIGER